MAGHSTTMIVAALNAVCHNGGADWFGLFAGDPDAGGVELAGGLYARVQALAPETSTASVTFADAEIEIPGGGTHPTHWARFATASGGSPYDSGELPSGGETFNSPGTLTITLTTDMDA